MKKINLSWILITLMIAAFLIGYGKMNNDNKSFLNFGGQKAEETVQEAITFISETMLDGAEAVLVSFSDESGVYKFKMKVNEEEYDSYLTKDGKILFPSGISLVEPEESSEVAQGEKMTCEDINKTKEPVLEAFVVSECPFGVQMQRILNEIVKNVPELASYIRMEYMGTIEDGKITSMHGDEESQENLRQICLREEQPNNLWAYIDCHIKEGNVDSCLQIAQIDVSKLTSCLTDRNRGLAYAEKDFTNQDKYEITGSPALILDGNKISEFDFGGRTAEAVKTVICCAFQDKPGFCDGTLSTESANSSFSPIYSSTESNAGGDATCN
jgi:predicted RNA-binding protein YlqC (UPF0109 family)